MKGLMQPVDFTRFFRAVGRVVSGLARRVTGVIQRQLGHANLGVTSIYLQGIDSGEIIETVRTRRAPVIPAAAALTR
ncbi:MAG: hypothetical protein WB462_02900 [Solirubrobacterales bacterium]